MQNKLKKTIIAVCTFLTLNSCSSIELPEQTSSSAKVFSKVAYRISNAIEMIPNLNKENIYFTFSNINLNLKDYVVPEEYVLRRYQEEDTFFEIFERKNKKQARKLLIVGNGGSFINAFRSFRRDFFVKKIGIKLDDFDIMIVDYRMGFQHRFPTQNVDYLNAYRSALKMGYDNDEIVFIGDSSGGNIILSSALYLAQNNLPMPKLVIAMSPYLDATNTVSSRINNRKLDVLFGSPSNKAPNLDILPYFVYLKDLKYEYASPIYAKNIKRFPKTLIQVGDFEILEDDSIEMYNVLKNNNLDVLLEEYPGMTHVFQMQDFEESDIAISNIIKFITQNIEIKEKKSFHSKKVLENIRFNIKFREKSEEEVLKHYDKIGLNLNFKKKIESQKYAQAGRHYLNIILDYNKYVIKE